MHAAIVASNDTWLVAVTALTAKDRYVLLHFSMIHKLSSDNAYNNKNYCNIYLILQIRLN